MGPYLGDEVRAHCCLLLRSSIPRDQSDGCSIQLALTTTGAYRRRVSFSGWCVTGAIASLWRALTVTIAHRCGWKQWSDAVV